MNVVSSDTLRKMVNCGPRCRCKQVRWTWPRFMPTQQEIASKNCGKLLLKELLNASKVIVDS